MAGGWSARARMSGPLTQYADGFEAELLGVGYTPGAADAQLWLMAQLDGWLAERELDATALSVVVVAEFLAPRAAARLRFRSVKALDPLLGYLRSLGVTPTPAVIEPVTPVELLLERYRCYLLVERGLTARTARSRVRIVAPFLAVAVDADGALELGRLRPGDAGAFVVASCRERGARWAREAVTALRSLLGFLHVEGLVGGELAAAVPSVASWRLTTVPQALGAGHVRLLLGSCDRATVVGCRDLAILTVLSRLGLRAGELAAMTLDDVDWRAGEIVVSNGKRRRRESLPLPADVGEVIADYLQHARPQGVSTRSVFVRVRAPIGGLSSEGVAEVVRSAGRRAGLGELGAHRLRHTAASDMLRAGAPLAEVGQVLRHRLPRTTAIYAKVDLQALRRIARPWPGAAA